MEENLVPLCTQRNRLDRNVGKDIKVPGSKSVQRAAAQISAVYKDHEILVTLKKCITLSLSF